MHTTTEVKKSESLVKRTQMKKLENRPQINLRNIKNDIFKNKIKKLINDP